MQLVQVSKFGKSLVNHQVLEQSLRTGITTTLGLILVS